MENISLRLYLQIVPETLRTVSIWNRVHRIFGIVVDSMRIVILLVKYSSASLTNSTDIFAQILGLIMSDFIWYIHGFHICDRSEFSKDYFSNATNI